VKREPPCSKLLTVPSQAGVLKPAGMSGQEKPFGLEICEIAAFGWKSRKRV
jgi:hypothetical protein